MLNNIIHKALIDHNFTTEEHKTEHTTFYKRESGASIRFAILHKLDKLISPTELNAIINKSAPNSFTEHPSFRKNCDLICVHRLKRLAEFKNNEEQIFALEEDPHFFKKYILYYSDTEESAINNFSYDDIKETISNKNLFSDYKNDPLVASKYSVAAKIFIKLPFLELPFTREKLVSLPLQAQKAVREKDLADVYAIIKKYTENDEENLIKELIENELENS